jgi:hypothetical protein
LKKFYPAVTALALLAVALIAAPAQASPLAVSPAQSAKTPHCVSDVTGVAPTVCYASFREAVRDATGGRVTDAPSSALAAMRDPAFEAKVNASSAQTSLSGLAAADTIISIEYTQRDYLGLDQIWTASRGCPDNNLNDVDWAIDDVNWTEDLISSFHGYANCWVKHYENRNQGGASTPFQYARTYIGDPLENRTSSIEWS